MEDKKESSFEFWLLEALHENYTSLIIDTIPCKDNININGVYVNKHEFKKTLNNYPMDTLFNIKKSVNIVVNDMLILEDDTLYRLIIGEGPWSKVPYFMIYSKKHGPIVIILHHGLKKKLSYINCNNEYVDLSNEMTFIFFYKKDFIYPSPHSP